jgi:hypothetical protein
VAQFNSTDPSIAGRSQRVKSVEPVVCRVLSLKIDAGSGCLLEEFLGKMQNSIDTLLIVPQYLVL